MALTLLLAFVIVPILEIYVIIQVGQAIGAPWTVGLLLGMSLVGAWLVKREGRRTWTALRGALSAGRIPNREVIEAALVLVGGTLLLTPGFITDVVGFLLVVPVSRPVARRVVTWLIAGRVARQVQRRSRRYGQRPPGSGPTVVQGEVIDRGDGMSGPPGPPG